jgi:hypothetical protein
MKENKKPPCQHQEDNTPQNEQNDFSLAQSHLVHVWPQSDATPYAQFVTVLADLLMLVDQLLLPLPQPST